MEARKKKESRVRIIEQRNSQFTVNVSSSVSRTGHCRRYEACQKTSGKRQIRAPLIPLPVISQQILRIAMDIVGPLPRSERGN